MTGGSRGCVCTGKADGINAVIGYLQLANRSKQKMLTLYVPWSWVGVVGVGRFDSTGDD